FRFFVQRHSDGTTRKEHSDVGPYLNAELTRLFDEKSGFNYDEEQGIFIKTFKIANQALGEDAFKKFNHSKGKYEGAISLPVYEAMSVALSNLIKSSKYDDEQLID
ncbi:TPA: DUF262 domain-containing protein, partial [Acinetobacter baumannii]|nr:DUF262 domain-containing protein [Acinetobacter baumannii]